MSERSEKLREHFEKTFYDIAPTDTTAYGYLHQWVAVLGANTSNKEISWRVHDTYSTLWPVNRVRLLYQEYGMSKRFIDACVWLWVIYEGRELYLKRNGHYPVNMWEFAWLAFNNEWDNLDPLLEMEI